MLYKSLGWFLIAVFLMVHITLDAILSTTIPFELCPKINYYVLDLSWAMSTIFLKMQNGFMVCTKPHPLPENMSCVCKLTGHWLIANLKLTCLVSSLFTLHTNVLPHLILELLILIIILILGSQLKLLPPLLQIIDT